MTIELFNWKLMLRSNLVLSPGQHEVGAGVVGPGACGAPLDGVDFFTVGLEVVDTWILLHTPDLWQKKRGDNNKAAVKTASWHYVTIHQKCIGWRPILHFFGQKLRFTSSVCGVDWPWVSCHQSRRPASCQWDPTWWRSPHSTVSKMRNS